MNVIELCGGLGNQLFQYAFGRAQIENGIDVKYDLSWYRRLEKKYPRPYRLDKFCVDVEIGSFTSRKFLREGEFNLNLIKRNNCNFKGYWQYYGYHENILSILKKEFQVKEEFYTKGFLKLRESIINANSVSIHVRRGDYVGKKNESFGCLPFQYYFRAIVEKVKGNLFVFSDDILWCKEYFKQDYFLQKIIFVHSQQDYLDFELMRLCKYNIIANSSFSWWAAYLNDDSEKIVVAPMQVVWPENVPLELRYPENWIKM